MTGAVPTGGFVDPAFAALGDAFRRNFEVGSDGRCDLGAALCVIAGGRVVADCWGGWRDLEGRRPWERDTLVNAYSVLKPVAAVLALRLVEQGAVDLDAPLAEVWPGFGVEGKEAVTLRHVLAHQAGLPGARPALPDEAIFDWDAMCAALVASAPWWEPGSAHGYHVNTFGFLAGEPVRRVTGAPFGVALHDQIAAPLGLDLYVGVPGAELPRVADVDAHTLPAPDPVAPLPVEGDEHSRMILHTYFNPRGASGIGIVNTTAWRRAAVPSTNGHATARAVAQFYAALLPGAPTPVLGCELLAEATRTHALGPDRVLGRPSHFGLGFALHLDERPVGTTPAAFGHYGYGGALGFADPEAGIAFAYLINRPGDRWQNPRTRGLLEALRACL